MNLPRPHIIEFDVKSLGEYLVVYELYEMIERQHGPVVARQIFSQATPTKRGRAFNKNVGLMVAFRKHKQLSVDRVAIKLAKENKRSRVNDDTARQAPPARQQWRNKFAGYRN